MRTRSEKFTKNVLVIGVGIDIETSNSVLI